MGLRNPDGLAESPDSATCVFLVRSRLSAAREQGCPCRSGQALCTITCIAAPRPWAQCVCGDALCGVVYIGDRPWGIRILYTMAKMVRKGVCVCRQRFAGFSGFSGFSGFGVSQGQDPEIEKFQRS